MIIILKLLDIVVNNLYEKHIYTIEIVILFLNDSALKVIVGYMKAKV